MPVIDVNGVALNYRELGSRSNRTIVFAHAVPFGPEVFDHIASEFSDDFHLILLDIHGHGESGYRTPLTLEGMADDYYQLLKELNLSNVIWVGFSIGGMTGMRLALRHPGVIGSLILIAASARLDPPQLSAQTWLLWEMFRDGHREDIADAALQFFFAPATHRDQPRLVEQYRDKLVNLKQAEGIFEAVRAVFDRADIGDQIGSITTPTLVIAGREDVVASPAESAHIASRIANARVAVIDDASHLVAVEKPREVARLIREFLR